MIPNLINICCLPLMLSFFLFYLFPKSEMDDKNEKFMKDCEKWYNENMPTLPKEFLKKDYCRKKRFPL